MAERSEVIANELIKIYAEKRPKMDLLGLEIGCLRGDFDFDLLSRLGNVRIISIDPAPDYNTIFTRWNQNIKVAERFQLITGTSDHVLHCMPRQFDFAFIDGDHSYEQTRRDILNCWRVIKQGGLLAGHNYEEFGDSAHPGVSQAVKEIFGKDNYSLGDDITWWKYV